MAYTRPATIWHAVTDRRGRHVQYIASTEALNAPSIGLCSTHDPADPTPARRMVRSADGWIAEPLDGEAKGLTIWGRHKAERPDLDEADRLDVDAADAVRSATVDA